MAGVKGGGRGRWPKNDEGKRLMHVIKRKGSGTSVRAEFILLPRDLPWDESESAEA